MITYAKGAGRPILALIAAAILAACQGPDQTPKVVEATSSKIMVVANYSSEQVRPLVTAHCEKFGRVPYPLDVTPVGDTALKGWSTGKKPYLFEYECK